MTAESLSVSLFFCFIYSLVDSSFQGMEEHCFIPQARLSEFCAKGSSLNFHLPQQLCGKYFGDLPITGPESVLFFGVELCPFLR